MKIILFIIMCLQAACCSFLNGRPYDITTDTFTDVIKREALSYWKQLGKDSFDSTVVIYIPRNQIKTFCAEDALGCYNGKIIYITAWQFQETCAQLMHEYGHAAEKILNIPAHSDNEYFEKYINETCARYSWMDEQHLRSPFL